MLEDEEEGQNEDTTDGIDDWCPRRTVRYAYKF